MGAGRESLSYFASGGPGAVVFVEGREVSSVHSPEIESEEDRMPEPKGA